jgi:hypothetical protein
VAVSFILGLAVTYLLESMVEAFRARRRCRLDWVPFAWVGCVFVHQFQFWWALYEIRDIPSMSVTIFALLLFLSALLFLAGALVLPSGEAEYPDDLAVYFTFDGSWGVAGIALYNASAVLANVLLFDVDPFLAGNLLNLGLALVAALVVAARSRPLLMALTLIYIVGLAVTTAANTPGSY